MLRLFLVVTLFAGPAPLARGAEAKGPKEKGSPASEDQAAEEKLTPIEQYEKLSREYQQAQREFFKPYFEAKTQQERAKIQLDFSKHPRKIYAEKFVSLADEHRGTPAALKALIWVVTYGRGDPAAVERAVDRLIEDHLTDAELSGAFRVLIYTASDDTERLFREAIEKNPHREVQGNACFFLAKLLTRQGLRTGDLPEETEQEAIALLQRVKAEFADVAYFRGTLGEAAEGELFELLHLRVGKVAPEIEGEDVDGEHFKLSDYRGQVVVLDFWGDW